MISPGDRVRERRTTALVLNKKGYSVNYLQSLTGRLFKLVFGGYVILAIVVTLVQLTLEYSSIQRTIATDLDALGQSFTGGVASAMWELDRPLLQTMAKGIAQAAIVTGVSIRSETGETMAQVGAIPAPLANTAHTLFAPYQSTTSPLVRQTPTGERDIGSLTIYTARSVAVNRIRYSFFVILVNSLIKTAGLWIIFWFVLSRRLARPLSRLTEVVSQLEFVAGSPREITLDYPHEDELGRLVGAMRTMQERLSASRQELDGVRLRLEETVAERTLHLSEALAFNEAILRESPVAMGVYRGRGPCVIVNQALARLVGATTEQLLAQDFRKVKTFRDAGLLDEDFFMYGEDLDWAYRIKQAGWKIYYNADVSVLHYKRASSRHSLRAQKEFYRAMLLFFRKHYAAQTPAPLRALVVAGIYASGALGVVRFWLARRLEGANGAEVAP